jgi:CRP-like cAMP-binding protein
MTMEQRVRQNPNSPSANRILSRLSADDRSQLQANLKKIELVEGLVLHPAGSPVEHVYFPTSGMICILALMRSGEAIDTAIVGKDGVIGASVACGGPRSSGHAVVQIAGCAWKIQSKYFLEVYKASATFRAIMNSFQTVILLQAQQSAACHALHSVEARLCRLLLQSQDTTEADIIPMTHEALSHLLGVQRNSVSLAAHALQNANLIEYHRGEVTILDRRGLKELACECYEVVREYIDNAVPPIGGERLGNPKGTQAGRGGRSGEGGPRSKRRRA